MLRVFKEYIAAIYLLLLYLESIGITTEITTNDAFRFIFNVPNNLTDGEKEHANYAFELLTNTRVNVSRAISDFKFNIETNLAKTNTDYSDGDLALINKIVKILGIPYSTNGLSAKNIRDLQQMLLTPGEITTSNKALLDSRTCSNCGEPIIDMQACTLLYKSGGTIAIACFSCVNPIYTVYNEESGAVTFKNDMLNKINLDIKKHEKSFSKEAKKEEAPVVTFRNILQATPTIAAPTPNRPNFEYMINRHNREANPIGHTQNFMLDAAIADVFDTAPTEEEEP